MTTERLIVARELAAEVAKWLRATNAPADVIRTQDRVGEFLYGEVDTTPEVRDFGSISGPSAIGDVGEWELGRGTYEPGMAL